MVRINQTAPAVIMDNKKQKEYEKYVKSVTPTFSTALQMLKAFITGGVICTIAQAVNTLFKGWGYDEKTSASWTLIIVILVTVILTGFNLFSKIVQFGGAGALVPITGFANSIASPAIEYKAEGHVFGIGVKIFTIAGPVILYGVFTSWVLGLIYWIGTIMGVV